MNLKINLIALFILLIMNTSGQINSKAKIIALHLKENGNFPNNSQLPVLIYKQVFMKEKMQAEHVERILFENHWQNSWRNGIYSFQHYHTTAHEVLVVYKGWAEVQLGGPDNKIHRIEKGDLVILPAGIAHKKIDSGEGFAVIGAYPDNQQWDMNYGKKEEKEQAKKQIKQVNLPAKDPVFGETGPVYKYWKNN